MELAHLVAGLSDPAAWPRPPDRVDLEQTHASLVFLGGDEVFKIKKPVNLGFLDYSTLARRQSACEAELALNRRLAPWVYLDLVPVTPGPRFGGPGEVLDWAVHMRRLPESSNFRSLLQRGRLDAPLLEGLAERLAGFFAEAESGPRVAASARFDVVARNCRENFEAAEAFVGATLSRSVWERFRAATETALAAMRERIEGRSGRARDGHGDLRLEHVYLIDGELVVIDCIEFDERFRHQDPVCDVAFLVMELELAFRPDLARAFTDRFFAASADPAGAVLLPLFVGYRHAVRGKVRSIEASEAEIPARARTRARRLARAHFLAGLARLAPPAERPALVLVGGLPGTGKTTLARTLEERAGFVRISSDETRKGLAGLAPEERAAAPFGEGLYTPEWTERTYRACRRRASTQLLAGRRVVVDASFREESRRRSFLRLARELGVEGLFLECRLPEEEAARRLAARRGDASDADLAVHREAAERFEPASPATLARRTLIPTLHDPLLPTLEALRNWGLAPISGGETAED